MKTKQLPAIVTALLLASVAKMAGIKPQLK